MCKAKEIINKMERQPTEWEKISANHIYGKILVFKAHTPELLKLNNKKTTKTSNLKQAKNLDTTPENIQMANKYAPYYMAEAEMLKQIESEAEIILSESFKEA